ncbi:sigma factor-like helix-turn-helix DNA-binding protein [Candidatus Symbiopectobacterium sp. 'North America']|uniref:sigma factor-like helix-turn-helix DNA-binding protein n=1 Tax=Candidatus Symbiopectobacterium sp. 'North America' TaxID=2794574 RepID=UPI001FD12A43|nr:sigma factor-like helix-turn-helix DNA-binding protein [Candidatus Symbiopectobacterium sp. 'North America']
MTLAEPEAIRNPLAYLMVTANHVMIDQFCKLKLEEYALAALAQLAEGAEAQSAEQRVAISQLVATALHILNEELDEKVQRAFIMARVEGHSYRDIAVTLGVSESSVKQYLAKAMIHFHTRIFSLESDEPES